MAHRVRIPPLLFAAAALALGDAIGLRLGAALAMRVEGSGLPDALPAAVRTPERPALLVGILLLLAGTCAFLAVRGRRASSGGAGPALCTCLLAGLALGAGAGGRVAGSCAASLRTGDPVRVRGVPETEIRAAEGGGSPSGAGDPTGRWARVLLRDVRLESRRGTCSLPRILARVERPASPLPAGRAVTVRGEWRSFGAPGDLRPVDLLGAVYGEAVPADGGRVASGPSLHRLRARAARRLEGLLPPDLTPAGRALLLADRTELDPRVTRRFADAGLAHMLAISGLHIGILGGGLLWLLGFVTRRPGRWIATACLTGGYVLLIGAPPAAVRAALLFAGIALGRWRGAPARGGDLLGLAAILALLARPVVLLHPGFQLSFAGFVGIGAGAGVGGRIRARIREAGAGGRWPSPGAARAAAGAVSLLAASTGAFLFTAPVAASHFGRVAPAAILSNLTAAPVLSLALAGLALAMVLPGPPAQMAAAGAGVAIRLLDRLAGFFAGLPLHGRVAAPGAVGWAVLLLLFGAGAIALSGRRWRVALPLGAAAALWLAAPAVHFLAARRATLLCTLDVGQGDAAVLRTRGGRWIVLDAGPGPGAGRPPGAADPASAGGSRGSWDAGRRVVLPFLRERGGGEIALFVLSHPHLDHVGGAGALFEAFRVRRVLDAGRPIPSGAYVGFLARVEEEGSEWLPATAGARARVDEVDLLVLGPPAPRAPGRRVSPLRDPVAERLGPADPNDASVIIRVRVDGAFTYLNTGDAPAAAERAVLASWPDDSLRADVLKIGHHGSRTSSAVPWLRTVRPRLAVLSVGGRNRYGHPHPETLARLDSAGVPSVWRTDRHGTLCLEIRPGGAWRARSARGPAGPGESGLDRGAGTG